MPKHKKINWNLMAGFKRRWFLVLVLGAFVLTSCFGALIYVNKNKADVATNDLSSSQYSNLPLNQRVLIAYNENYPDSLEVAQYYAFKRNISSDNLCALPIATEGLVDGYGDFYSSTSTTAMNWGQQYDAWVKTPIQNCLERIGVKKILYIVMSYKTPYRTGAGSVDQYVSDIWDINAPAGTERSGHPYYAPSDSVANTFASFTSFANYRDQEGANLYYGVWRLDGGSKEIAKGLVDKALQAEQNGGLQGAACIDLRYMGYYKYWNNINFEDYDHNNTYEWDVYRSWKLAESAGLSAQVDTSNVVISNAGADIEKCNNTALYTGWYNSDGSRSWYNDVYDWAPGAIGVDINSFSLNNTRGGTWGADAINHGLTVTSGPVSEPWGKMPSMDQVFHDVFSGANVADAFLRATAVVKGVMVNIGDPLYKPFSNPKNNFLPYSQVPGAHLAISNIGIVSTVGQCKTYGIGFYDAQGQPIKSPAPLSLEIRGQTNHDSHFLENCRTDISKFRSSGGGVYPYINVTIPSGSSLASFSYLPTLSGEEQLTLTSSSNFQPLTDSTITLNTNGLSSNKFHFSVAPPATASLNTVITPSPAMTLKNSSGQIIENETSTPYLRPYYDSKCQSPNYSSATKGIWSNNQVTFAGVVFNSPGTYYVAASDTNNQSECFGPIQIGNNSGPTIYFKNLQNGTQLSRNNQLSFNTLINDADGIQSAKLFKDGAELSATEANLNRNENLYSFSYQIPDFERYGRHNLSIRATDSLNNSITSNSVEFIVIPQDFGEANPISISMPNIKHTYPNRSIALAPTVSGATSYIWTKASGPDNSNVVFGNANAASTSVIFNLPGTYNLTFTANDNSSHTASINIPVYVHKLGDINNKDGINFDDLTLLLANWGAPIDPMADQNGDGIVDFQNDFTLLLFLWVN